MTKKIILTEKKNPKHKIILTPKPLPKRPNKRRLA